MKDQFKIIQNMGIPWTVYRAKYELKKKLGIIHRDFIPKLLSNSNFLNQHVSTICSEEELLDYIRKKKAAFFFGKDTALIYNQVRDLLTKSEQERVVEKAREVLNNKFTYFSYKAFKFENINWHYSPFTNKGAPKERHWLDISDLNSDFGDIKFIWELSRFPFVYDLVRAYGLTGDDRFAQKYWDLVEDWLEHNRMEYGVNYKDGQEMSLRVMSWLFGLYAFIDHDETTPSRVTTLLKSIYLHFEHIDKHFDFALKSVRNNHTISEAAGLYTVGILFPFMDKSKKWLDKGKKYLEKEAMWQIYDDGSYIQNSMNYHRLMLQDYTWAIRLGEINNDHFSNKLIDRLKKATLFLYQNQTLSNGRVPNYGMNDGALIHPLSTKDYLDYRPQLNTAWMTLTKERLYPNGSYDENVLWLFGPDALNNKYEQIEQKSTKFPEGGYFTFRSHEGFGMTRCTSFKHRPAQADMLHFDLWIKDINVLSDGGTYSYNTDSKITAYYNGTSSHNTVMIDNKDQMKKGNRFIWLDWTRSKLLKYDNTSDYTIFEGEHYGYKPLTHRRGILNLKDHWIIVDDVFGTFNSTTNVQLSWLFGIDDVKNNNANEWSFNIYDERYKLINIASQTTKSEMLNGNSEPFKGWQSLYYGVNEERPQLVISIDNDKASRFITIITKYNTKIDINDKRIRCGEDTIEILPIGSSNIFSEIKG